MDKHGEIRDGETPNPNPPEPVKGAGVGPCPVPKLCDQPRSYDDLSRVAARIIGRALRLRDR